MESILDHRTDFEDVPLPDRETVHLVLLTQYPGRDSLLSEMERLWWIRTNLGTRGPVRVSSLFHLLKESPFSFAPRGARDVLEAYWEITGGKPVQKTKRRGRPASGSVKKKGATKSEDGCIGRVAAPGAVGRKLGWTCAGRVNHWKGREGRFMGLPIMEWKEDRRQFHSQ